MVGRFHEMTRLLFYRIIFFAARVNKIKSGRMTFYFLTDESSAEWISLQKKAVQDAISLLNLSGKEEYKKIVEEGVGCIIFLDGSPFSFRSFRRTFVVRYTKGTTDDYVYLASVMVYLGAGYLWSTKKDKGVETYLEVASSKQKEFLAKIEGTEPLLTWLRAEYAKNSYVNWGR